ncbi:NfeD family protein [uncultured Desulfobacter sp.]|uniref:NfeD family protein n=1 Tax=uncultured Desulfobacter sp. TaxID=240139 RepID=UPI0029F57FC1|nr:NfeD family protein [uncultured Desulfobacter sp.]
MLPEQKSPQIWATVLFFVLILYSAVQAVEPVVHIIPVSGTVEPGMAAYLKRVVSSFEKDDNAVLVFAMDTFGGRVDAAFDIVETICSVPKERTIAYVEKRAISAGALIALSAGTLVMKENTLIGDCAPIIQTSEGIQEVGEKHQTVLRAQFRTLAKRNNYSEVLAESMVSKSMEVYKITRGEHSEYMDKTTWQELSEKEKKKITRKTTVVSEGELLTMDDKEAVELGFSRQSVESLDQALEVLGYGAAEKIEVSENWSETFVRWIQPLLPILMIIGIGAVYTEVKAPGFGIPGIIGIICLGLVFFNQYLVGLADYTEILVFVIGFLLLGMEMFVLPGFGIAGVTAIIVLAAGLVLSFQNFVLPDPSLPWQGELMIKNLGLVLGSALGALLVSMSAVRFALPRLSKVINGPYLEATLQDSRAESSEALGICAGDEGVALTTLRPSGKVSIKDRKIDAVTQGDFIDPGTSVRVARVTAGHVIVETIMEKREK